MFGSQRRLVRRWECETFIPKLGFLPQISQTAAMTPYPFQLTGKKRGAQGPGEPFLCGEAHYHSLTRVCYGGSGATAPSDPFERQAQIPRGRSKRIQGLSPA